MVVSANDIGWFVLYNTIMETHHMSGLLDHLKQQISADGAMTVANYMTECLANPEYGYYILNEPFGVSGDFVTAPEISQMFGELLGLWAVHQWHAMDKP